MLGTERPRSRRIMNPDAKITEKDNSSGEECNGEPFSSRIESSVLGVWER